MPWNDNANPGPWGSPPGEEPGATRAGPARPDEPRRRPPSLPPPPRGPDFQDLRRRLSEAARYIGRRAGRQGAGPQLLAALAIVGLLAWT